MINDIPSDSDDDRLDIDNGVTEVDEVGQANPMHRQPKGERCMPKCITLYHLNTVLGDDEE